MDCFTGSVKVAGRSRVVLSYILVYCYLNFYFEIKVIIWFQNVFHMVCALFVDLSVRCLYNAMTFSVLSGGLLC